MPVKMIEQVTCDKCGDAATDRKGYTVFWGADDDSAPRDSYVLDNDCADEMNATELVEELLDNGIYYPEIERHTP